MEGGGREPVKKSISGDKEKYNNAISIVGFLFLRYAVIFCSFSSSAFLEKFQRYASWLEEIHKENQDM